MLTPQEVCIIGSNAEFHGISIYELMERAGKAVSDFINSLYQDAKTILVLCGPGNNGGNGFVAARYLSEKYSVDVFHLQTQKSPMPSRKNLDRLTQKQVTIHTDISDISKLIQKSDIVIDALLGLGIRGEPRDPIAGLIRQLNASNCPIIISIDVPSGLGSKLRVRPHATITLHDVKKGMTEKLCGTIHIVDIGIPQEATTCIGPGDLIAYFPRPETQSHKGQTGVVLVIGGGPNNGAPALSGLAALRTGADLVYIATPKKSWEIISSYSPDFIVKDLSGEYLVGEDLTLLEDILSRTNAIVIGPGLGRELETMEAVYTFINDFLQRKIPLVLDADAIHALGENVNILHNTTTVVTPHVGEFTKLTGKQLPTESEKRISIVQQWAKKMNITFCVKGPIDIISDGYITKLNQTHNIGMSVGGTGDTLAGIIGALLSKEVKPVFAAGIGTFLNGFAGNQVFKKKSYGLTASDIVEQIPTILNKYL